MIGIKSYGGYIPRLRLNRMSIVQAMGWFAPAIITVAQGERSFCNWDEDSLTMAVAAARDCLKGMDKQQTDALYLCSTTLPFADRLNAGILKTVLHLPDAISAADITDSQRAGTTGLLQALRGVKSGETNQALVAAADQRMTKTAYFYEMWFGDGAAALLVGQGDDVIAEFLGAHSVTHDFIDHYRGQGRQVDYMWEERWVRDMGYATIIPQAVNGLFAKLGIGMDDVDKLVFPCFFAAEAKNIARKLGAGPEKLMGNLHEQCGETGAAHALVLFVKALEEAKPGDRILLAGFGQGCDAMYFRVTEASAKLAPRLGVNGSLKRKLTTDNYAKFLVFREQLQPEMGIRAEAPKHTALSTLWRKRDQIMGLVGGQCQKCGTPQFPPQRTCVNPDCRAIDSLAPYEFADQPAVVKSFTGDLLAVSVDPPAVYGMVEFVNGGRFLFDFTDCVMDDLSVGQNVEMVFRRRYVDDDRGFSGYFWKAAPLPKAKATAQAAEQIRFDGQVAIVTGAGAGLGRTYALELAKRGAKVVINDLGGARDGKGGDAAAADKVVREIIEAGGQAVANYDSVSTPEGGANIVKTAMDAFGRVDILVNNAGILRDMTLLRMAPENWRAVVDVHLKGAYNVTRPAFAVMRDQAYGRIIFTTSAAGLYGNFGQTNYSAAKMALVGLMNTVKLEGGRYNILANTVAPLAATRLTEDIMPPDFFEKTKPEFVAPLVLYLASERCEHSGQIFNAGVGYFNRAAIVTGQGAVIGDGQTPPTIEDIHDNFAAICDMAGGQEHNDAMAALGQIINAFSAKPAGGGQKDQAAEQVQAVFSAMPGAFQAGAAAGLSVVFQFSLAGQGGGEWFAAIADGACAVEKGVHEKPTTTIKMDAGDFVKMIKGELNAMAAFTSGKLKIDGDVMKSQLIEKLFKF
ncbi:short-chain dehydrogenase/reductase SDR [Desulfarculus baarsii DSM 2075]|uniref:Short-chain dehydrogenase/reductase SDR n=1 Tax=Desulfarculus baarsii (strain ATCC 33931 / DSM 2075 / LMG 7858 / VKM B-1802 / 2st14) TaxID=644282 RepID=E1QLQ1_DESB2|nr:SDR family NAD(P)-dependent oxidoreductase [Desulfarculus baarsii]ADK86486.1 short-chain dehydrogenase/reductase SDR [Desulfarculus baarsii DSM 2075]